MTEYCVFLHKCIVSIGIDILYVFCSFSVAPHFYVQFSILLPMPYRPRPARQRRGSLIPNGGVRRTRQQSAVRLVSLVALTAALDVISVVVATGTRRQRAPTAGQRSHAAMSQTLITLSDCDFRHFFRMGRLDVLALLQIARGGLETGEEIAVLATGEPIPEDCRLSLALRMLAGATYLDCMLAFCVKRCTVFYIFHQVCLGASLRNLVRLAGVCRGEEKGVHQCACDSDLSLSFLFLCACRWSTFWTRPLSEETLCFPTASLRLSSKATSFRATGATLSEAASRQSVASLSASGGRLSPTRPTRSPTTTARPFLR